MISNFPSFTYISVIIIFMQNLCYSIIFPLLCQAIYLKDKILIYLLGVSESLFVFFVQKKHLFQFKKK